MRRLMAVLLLLCSAALSALAETPAVDEAILGSWEPVLPIADNKMYFNATFTAQPIIIITADGINPVGYPPVPSCTAALPNGGICWMAPAPKRFS